jgi:hypothetical protein
MFPQALVILHDPTIYFITVFNFSIQNYSPRLFRVFSLNHSNQNVISAHALRHILLPALTVIFISAPQFGVQRLWRET